MDTLISLPDEPIVQRLLYAVSAREKRSFHTPLDASVLLDPASTAPCIVTIATRQAADIDRGVHAVVTMSIPIRNGRIEERFEGTETEAGLRSKAFTRRVTNAKGDTVRLEEVDFSDPTIPLPDSAYPEVMLPFLLAWQPDDKKQRSLYAWINDRFVAHVYYERDKKTSVKVPSGSFESTEVLMVPDLNEWVPLGKILNTLSKPFVPKYRMWFSNEQPRQVLRFEGPQGPPGAPEIVLELTRDEGGV